MLIDGACPAHQGWSYGCDCPEGVLRPGSALQTVADAVFL